MRLISLKINNFRILRELSLEFPDCVIGLVGPNGAGKSSVIEAISWALYGQQASRSGRDEIKSAFAGSEENCEVTLDFSIRAEKYRVCRRLVGRTLRPEVEFWHEGEAVSVGTAGSKGFVGELLGLDWRGFLTSFLARQQELSALSDLQPARRRDHLAGMLGIQRLDQAIDRLKVDTKLQSQKVDLLARRVEDRPQLARQAEDIAHRIGELAGKVAAKRTDVRLANEHLEQVVKRQSRLDVVRSQWLQITARLEAEKRSQETLAERKISLQAELERLRNDKLRMAELREHLKGVDVLRGRKELLSQAKHMLATREHLARRLADEQKKLADGRAVLKEVEEQAEKWRKVRAGIPADIQAHLTRTEIDLSKSRQEYTRLSGECRSTESEINRLKEQLDSISSLGPESICDRCLRPMGDDLPAIREHIQGELDGLQATLGEYAAQLETVTSRGKDLKALEKQLKAESRELYEANVQFEQLERRLEDLQVSQSKRKSDIDDIGSQLTAIGEVNFDQVQLDDVSSELSRLQLEQSRYDELKGKLIRLDDAESELSKTKASLAGATVQIAAMVEELGELAFDEKEFKRGNEELSTARKDNELARSAMLGVSTEEELAKKDLDVCLAQIEVQKQDAEDLEECRNDHYYSEKLGGLFGQFKQHVIAQIRPTLSNLAGRLMNDMTDGRYGMVELDEKYNLRLMDEGCYYPVERFSGGEKDMANLCLRLAISQSLTESAGLDRSFVILDEVFGSQDDRRRELVLGALAGLKQWFPQVLLVTHIGDIKDKVERLIEIQRSERGWSEVVDHGSIN